MNKPLFTVRVDVLHRVDPATKAQPSRRRRQPGASIPRNSEPKLIGEIIAELLGQQKKKSK